MLFLLNLTIKWFALSLLISMCSNEIKMSRKLSSKHEAGSGMGGGGGGRGHDPAFLLLFHENTASHFLFIIIAILHPVLNFGKSHFLRAVKF